MIESMQESQNGKIWLIKQGSGQYEDYHEITLGYALSEEEARKEAERIHKGTPTVNEERERVYDSLLFDFDEFYSYTYDEEYAKIPKDVYDESNGAPYVKDMVKYSEFNREIENREREAMIKYFEENGMSESEMVQIENYKKYMEMDFGDPFIEEVYSMNKNKQGRTIWINYGD